MKFATYVETNWNLLCALLYARHQKADKITIIKGGELSLLEYLDSSKKIEIEIIDVHSGSLGGVSKVRSIFTLKNVWKVIGDVEVFIKFSNFSPSVQFLSENIAHRQTVLIDDGFLLFNLFHPEQKYALDSKLKRLFFKVVYGKFPKFDFLDFSGVNLAYFVQPNEWKVRLDCDAGFEVRSIAEFFSFENIKILVEELFLLDEQVNRWKYINRDMTVLVLGGAFVSHNMLSSDQYEELLVKIVNNNLSKTIYKPHPSEVEQPIPAGVTGEIFPFLDVPIEIFLAFSAPQAVVGFGSATQFLIDYVRYPCENLVALSEDIYSSKFIQEFELIASRRTELMRI